MLRIRDEQMRVFQAARDRAFARSVADWLRESHAATVTALAPAELERRVLVGLARATGHGLADERAIMRFILVMFDVGPSFDEYPPIRAALAKPGSSAELRFSDMMALTTADDWAGARASRDDAAWGEPAALPGERST